MSIQESKNIYERYEESIEGSKDHDALLRNIGKMFESKTLHPSEKEKLLLVSKKKLFDLMDNTKAKLSQNGFI